MDSLKQKPLFSLFKISISIHHINKKSEEKYGLSLVQWYVLEKLIDLPGTSAHLLAKSVGVHPSTLTQTLKRLERKKFLFQTEDPKDNRKKIIALTKSGKEALDKVATDMQSLTNALNPQAPELLKLNTFLQAQIKKHFT